MILDKDGVYLTYAAGLTFLLLKDEYSAEGIAITPNYTHSGSWDSDHIKSNASKVHYICTTSELIQAIQNIKEAQDNG